MRRDRVNYQYKQRKKHLRKQYLIIFIIFMCTISFIYTLGRYVTNNFNNFFARSKEFYFNSDKLTKNTANFHIQNWSGVDDYLITINMNSFKNNIEAATYDIGYEISYTCSNNIICQLSKTTGNILASTNTDYFNLTVTPNAHFKTGDKAWVEIVVTSTSDYKQTLKGDFTLIVGREAFEYEIKDSVASPYLELNLTNTLSYYIVDEPFGEYVKDQKIDIDTYLALSETDKNKCYSTIVTVEFDPRKVLLDITDANYMNATDVKTTVINGTQYIFGFKLKVDAVSSSNIRFYKVDPQQDYTYPNLNDQSVLSVTSR